MKHFFSIEEFAFIRANIAGRNRRDFLDVFNAKFGLTLAYSQLLACLKNHHIGNGKDGRFPPGHIPFNKGVKGIRVSPRTEFKKGNLPVNHMPVGSERVNSYGYVDVKIADPNKWKLKHRIIWEATNGPVPHGSVLIFADGNKLNVTPDNILLVSRAELAVMNRYSLIANSKELTTLGRSTAALKIAIASKSRR